MRGPRPRPLDESALFHKSNAEAGGFEPPVRLPVRQFSKLLVSATHPNFQYFLCGSVFSQTRCKDKRSFRPVQAFEAFFSYLFTALSFKTTSIILVILRKTIIFAHSDAGSTASGVSFYRSYKIIFVGGNQMRQRSFFDFRLNFRYAKIRFILLICNILNV